MARDGRQEPRGFDEQWAADAAEIERWRSVHRGKAREPHDVAPPRRPHEEPQRGAPRARRTGLTVIAGGLVIGGLLLYLLITLSGIGPPKQFMRQTEVPTKPAPVDAKREAPRKASAPMTLEERRLEEDKRTPVARQRSAIRQANQAALSSATESSGQREDAWQRFYQPSETCQAFESRGTIACANEYARAKMEFEKRWAEGRL